MLLCSSVICLLAAAHSPCVFLTVGFLYEASEQEESLRRRRNAVEHEQVHLVRTHIMEVRERWGRSAGVGEGVRESEAGRKEAFER